MLKISLLFLLFSFSAFSQNGELKKKLEKLKDIELKQYKLESYFGYQRGLYDVIEFGYEGVKKHIKLIKPTTYAVNTGVTYDVFRNVVGFDAGVWGKSEGLAQPSEQNSFYEAILKTRKLAWRRCSDSVSDQLIYKLAITF